MSSKVVIGFTVLSLVCVANTRGQTYSDQGLLGASGIALMPTTTIAPKAQFRAFVGRLSMLGGGERALNFGGVSGGFSPSVEAYIRVAEDKAVQPISLTSYAVGLKYLLPFSLPGTEQLALWGEGVNSEQTDGGALYPTGVTRLGLSAMLIQNSVRPSAFAGVTLRSHSAAPMAGAGVTVAAGHSTQVGAEAVYGYAGAGTGHLLLSGAFRVVSNLCIQICSGYQEGRNASGMVISAGFTLGTADIDFAPVVEEQRPDFKIPTFDEIEKQSTEEPKQ